MSKSPPDPAASKRQFDVAGASGPRGVLWATVLPVWLAAVTLSTLIGLVVPKTAATWLAIAFGLCTLIAFALQLLVPTTPGHMSRLGWGVGGALVILGLASVVLFVLWPPA
ncbi:hypothetical protein [uncultured Agrococcus sp.]|uniref:hypothetical protein n=1 Tax=uncultured Agrococcus sp. TaxID=382258 RepID=UPI0025ED8AF0|nr:hypothetical protein [uncultured Agrococcus sp.]